MIETINAIVGGGIIVLNLIPFLIKQYRYLFLTAMVSMLMVVVLQVLR